MRRGFVSAGTWCVDKNVTLPAWPEEDMLATATDVVLSGGGSACNFAVDMRRLDPDIPVETMGLVGTDAEGDLLVATAERYGIAAPGLRRTAEAPTHLSEAFHSIRSGRRTHILFEGASVLLCPDHFDFGETDARILHLGLPGIHRKMDGTWGGDANGWVTVLKKAQAAGLETNLELVAADAERIRALVLPCLPHLTTLVVNDHEIGALAETPTVAGGVTDPQACLAAARAILARGAMELVAVHFPTGAVLCARDGTAVARPSVRVADAERRGANGAGDAFAAGFFCARHHGLPYEECLTLGHAAAAASLRAVTTTDGVGSMEECRALAERWGWR